MTQRGIVSVLGLALAVGSCGGADEPRQASAVKVVPHQTLLEFLPNLPGWSQEGAPQGDTDTAEGVSRVQVTYEQQGGIGGISIEIMDTTTNTEMLAPLVDFFKANRTETAGDPTAPMIITPMEVAGFPARQEWTAAANANNGTLAVLVAGRFTVGITGNSLPNAGEMRRAAEAVDLKKLAALK